MNNWDDLKLILALSRYGTLSSAANSLGISTATVSRRLEKCAEEVGQTLFVRRGQTWKPTSSALSLIELAETVTEGFPNGKQSATFDHLEERVIRASMPLDICIDRLSPHLQSFLNDNFGLTLDVFHEAKSVAFGEVDVRLSYEEPTEGRLVRVRLGATEYDSFVSATIKDEPTGWVDIIDFERKSRPMAKALADQFGRPRLRTASITCAMDIVHEIPLVVNLPTQLADRQGNLIPWRPESQSHFYPIWATYHESRKLDPDVRLMLGFLKHCFRI